jgi:tetratricopeptide (TPR) repeat protein
VVHAAIDWDWQMPVITLPVFALAGAAFAGSKPASALASRLAVRIALAGGVLVLALIPAFATVSEWHFQRALGWYEADDCSNATSEAHAALKGLSFRPDAHEILGFCEAAAGKRPAALRDLQLAVAEDPDNWETHYGLSIVEAIAKRDPRAEMAQAQELNPKDPRVFFAASFFRPELRHYWAQEAALDLLQVAGQGEATIAALRPRRAP